MSKKITFLFVLIFVLITGCSYLNESEYISYIDIIGPNNMECHSFYHYMNVEGGYDDSGLQRYDTITGKDQEIYIVSDPKNQRISSFCGNDKEVYYVETTSKKDSRENALYYCDVSSGKYEKILKTEEYLAVFQDSNTNEIKVKTDSQGYIADNIFLQKVDDSKMIKDVYSSDEDNVRLFDAEGNLIEINKKYGSSDFFCSINGTSNIITILSEYNGEDSGLSNFFTIEGDKVIGIIQITKGKMGKLPKNLIRFNELKKEILVSIDYKTGQNEMLYDTQSNNIRIVGYSNGNVYLLKGGIIFCRNMSDGSEKEIYSLPYKGNNQLSFSWIGSKLIVFDKNDLQVVANIQT